MKSGVPCNIIVNNKGNSFGFIVSDEQLFIPSAEINFKKAEYTNAARQLILAYIGAKQHHINVHINDPLYDLPWEKLDSFTVSWMYDEDHRVYKKLVDEGKLKHFKTTTLIDNHVVEVEYKAK